MLPTADHRIASLLKVVFLSTAIACGSSSSDVASEDIDSGGVVNSAAGGGGAGGGGAGGGGAGGAAGNTLVDAGQAGRPGSTSPGDAAIDIEPDGPWKVASLPAVGAPGIVYLSDLVPTKVALFEHIGGAAQSGPMHNDVSFTGKPLVINGVYYAKGLGVHTYAQITYALGGAYKQFVSDTGLDYLENSSTMIFEVSLDGNLSYDNGNGTKTKEQVAPVSLDVTGKSTLMLYVRDGFDDTSGDFGVWGGARLVK